MLAVAAHTGRIHNGWMTTKSAKEDAEAKLLGRALQRLRDERNITQPQAAEAFGIDSAQGWGKYERGLAPTIHYPEIQRRLVAAIGATVDDLIAMRSTLDTPVGANPRQVAPPRERKAELTPYPGMCGVFGLASGAGERIALAPGAEVRWVPMHPNQKGYAKVGAAEIAGESMYPRYKPRELAFFIFDLMPPRGEDAIVELTDGTAIVREYFGRTPENLLVKEFSPREHVHEIPLSQVAALHAVVGR